MDVPSDLFREERIRSTYEQTQDEERDVTSC